MSRLLPRALAVAGLLVCLCLAQALAAPTRNQNLLSNPGLEPLGGTAGAGWSKYGGGGGDFVAEGRTGKGALYCRSASMEESHGAMQEVTFDPPLRHPLVFSGWSKAESALGADYCLYLDCFYDDGTPLWGQRINFAAGTHGWQRVTQTLVPEKPLAKIQFFVLFRHCTGRAWFDDLSLSLSPFEVQGRSVLPSLYGGNSIDYSARLSLPAAWTASVLRGGETVYSQSGTGTGVNLAWAGQDAAGRLQPGGKYTVRLAARDDLLGEALQQDTAVTTLSGAGQGYVAWAESSANRVLINRLPGPRRSLQARLGLARNESESFQVAIRTAPGTELKGCTVKTNDLTCGRSRLRAANVRFEQVGWVKLDALSPASHLPADALPGWWPDPLLPVSRFDVAPATTQALWFTVYAPPGTRPGLYSGEVSIQPRNAPALRVPLEATVYNFELPTQGHLKTAFALMDGYLEKLYGKPLSPLMRRKYGDFALQYRLNPDDISRTDPPDLDDLEHYNTRGMNAFNIINMVQPRGNRTWVCWSPLEVYTPTFKQSLIARLDPYVAELKKRGLFDKAYCYTFDERGEDFYPVIEEYFGLMRERWGIPTLTTSRVKQQPQAMRELNVDWNCPVSSVYHFDEAEACRKAGLQVWSYVCCGPRQPFANFLAEDNLLEARLIWWQAYQQKMDGFLYWGLNIWDRKENNYLIDPEQDGPRLRWSITTGGNEAWLRTLHGDGELLYAGKDGPLGCIRLAGLRDGLDDYEYLYLLARLTGSVEQARQACAPVTTSLVNYTTDPEVLLKQREAIARRIEKLSAGRPGN